MNAILQRGLRAFVSYSHRDERYRQRLEISFASLRRSGLISTWYDRKILPGEEWEDEIDENLNSADLVLTLVSPDFLASDYAYSREMSRALERRRSGSAIVVPIILRPSDWQNSPLGSLQALPREGRAVSSWPNRDEAWLDVVQGLRRLVESGLERPHTPTENGLPKEAMKKGNISIRITAPLGIRSVTDEIKFSEFSAEMSGPTGRGDDHNVLRYRLDGHISSTGSNRLSLSKITVDVYIITNREYPQGTFSVGQDGDFTSVIYLDRYTSSATFRFKVQKLGEVIADFRIPVETKPQLLS